MTQREKQLLTIAAVAIPAILIVRFGFLGDKKTALVAVGESVPQAEKRLAKLRQIAVAVPSKEMVLKQVDADLAAREKGILNVETAPQAQARLLEIARNVAKTEGIDVRGGDFGQPKNFGSDYGEVTAVVTFECRIDQFVNFMAGISREPELIGPVDLRIASANLKEKTVQVRMTLGGLVPKKMVPEKKGFAAF